MYTSDLKRVLVVSSLACVLVWATPAAFGQDDDLYNPLPSYPTDEPSWTTTPALTGLPVGAVLVDHVDEDRSAQAFLGVSYGRGYLLLPPSPLRSEGGG